MVEPVSDNILNLVNELYNNLDAKDKIINEQALEIARLKEELENDIDRYERLKQEHIDTITRNEEKQQRIDKAIEYIKSINYVKKAWKLGGVEKTNEDILLEILGGKEDES